MQETHYIAYSIYILTLVINKTQVKVIKVGNPRGHNTYILPIVGWLAAVVEDSGYTDECMHKHAIAKGIWEGLW